MAKMFILSRELSDYQWENCSHGTAPHSEGQCCKLCALNFIVKKIEEVRQEGSELKMKCSTCDKKKIESLQTKEQQLKQTISLLSKVNKIIFDNCKHSLGDLRYSSYLHSQINSIVAEQQTIV